jgi:transposase
MKTADLFKVALGISKPWYVTEIKFNALEKQLDIFIDFEVGSSFPYKDENGEIYENCKPYDTVEKKWRHLNFFQHECYLHARVPRVQTPNGNVRLVSTPWEGKNT